MTVNQELLSNTKHVQEQKGAITLVWKTTTTDTDKTTLQQPQKRVGASSSCHPGHQGTSVGPGKDTHDTPMPEREGRGWPTTRSTVRQTCTTKKTGTVFNNVHGSEAVLSLVSSARIQQRTEQIVQRRQEVDGQFVGSRKQPRQRTQGDTPDLSDRGQECGVDRQSPE